MLANQRPLFIFKTCYLGFDSHNCFTFFLQLGFAQKSTIYTSDLKDFNEAVALFKDGQYASAQIIFNKVRETATTEEATPAAETTTTEEAPKTEE